MTVLSQEEEVIAKAWMHDVLYWGGLLSKPKRALSIHDYQYMYGGKNGEDVNGKEAATTICEFIKNINNISYDTFVKLDSALVVLSAERFSKSLNVTTDEFVTKTPETLALYLAYFLKHSLKKLIDNSNLTMSEMSKVTEKTLSGKAFATYEVFTVGQAGSTQKVDVDGNVVPTQKPQINYRKTGPQSAHAIGLVGKPFQKEILAVKNLYFIAAEKNNPNTGNFPCANINPVKYTNINYKSYDQNGICKVRMSFANSGFSSMIYLTDKVLADEICAKMIAEYQNNDNIRNIKVYTTNKVDKNGYFKFRTNVGEVYIRARRLNEEKIDENCEESFFKKYIETEDDYEAFDEALYSSMN